MTALVFGGHSPLAIETAKLLATDGGAVGLVTRERDTGLLDELADNPTITTIEADLARPGAGSAALAEFELGNGPATGLVFLHRFRGPEADAAEQFQVEVLSTSEVIARFSEGPARRPRSVVIATSPASNSILRDQPFSYHASKAALDQLTRWAACRYGPNGVRVNAIRPSSIILKERAKAYYDEHPELVEMYERIIPLRRMGRPRDIAEAVALLLSDACEYLTGEVITIDGGVGLMDAAGIARTASEI